MRRTTVMIGFVGCGGLLMALSPSFGQRPPADWWAWFEADPERALVLALAGIAWLLAAWLFLVTGLSLISTTSSSLGRLAHALLRLIAPTAVRRCLEGALGIALAVGPAGGALAGPGVGSLQASPARSPAVTQTGLPAVPRPILAPVELPLPDLDRPATGQTPSPSPKPAPTPTSSPQPTPPTPPTDVTVPTHVVATGDTLWSLAAADLPPGANPLQITVAWQRWYTVNRQQIGADPGLLLPGQVLVAAQLTP